MSPAPHSTGPWQVNGMAGAGFWIVGADDDQIAVAYGPEVTKSGVANARLISAAPEMLEALKLVREFDVKHAPALMSLPFFKAMHEAVFKAIIKAEAADK